MDDYDVARTIAGTLIEGHDGELTVEVIRQSVSNACTLPPASNLSTEHQEKLIWELETTHQTVIGEERDLVADDEAWEPWLPARKGHLDLYYWQRFEELLKRGPMNPDVRARLDRSTDRVLGYLGDPFKTDSWDRRGLVVGLVQSGKTSHYIGLINKAVDAGYKVIVVLTGFTESLRVQTQIRAEEGFLGYYLEPIVKKAEIRSRRLGVGLISPERIPDSVTTRSNDFKKAVADNLGIQVGGNEILFVIKKNVGVLRNLLNWIESFGNATDASGQRFVKEVPLLVIDDESDVGSIDTKKGNIVDDDPDPDHEPSRINEQIRKLLSLFDQSSYVGYTATPFANVLIHEGAQTEELGEDLFPRSFIVSLPTPSDHVGPSMVFGLGPEGDEQQEGLPIIRQVPKKECVGEGVWIPPVHKKTHRPLFEGRDQVPPSLRKALLSFVLVCAARLLRDSGTKHNSMLVHVTRFNDVQDEVGDQVKKELKGVIDRLRTGVADSALLGEFRELWEGDFVATTRKIAEKDGTIFRNQTHGWTEVQAELLRAASSIQVRTINGLAGEVLDYELHRDDGLNVIAIGGDKLSRGLTLEGLSVSYFLRSSRMYDTLMQMGRWFGYRPGYLDLCRLFTTSELSEWFGHIADATEELRSEFDLMANSGGTPKDFGLRVRSHPELMVTSRVKMRHGKNVQVSFQGDIIETINFCRDSATVEANWLAGGEMAQALDSGSGIAGTTRPHCAIWSEVPAERVLTFLERYSEHESAIKARTRLLGEYIEAETERGRLGTWTVFISAGKSDRKGQLGKHRIPMVERRWDKGRGTEEEQQARWMDLLNNNQYRIRRLVSPSDEEVDLDPEIVKEVLEETKEAYRRDPKRRKKEPDTPSGKLLRQRRDPKRGLLILYPLVPDDEKSIDGDVPILGFAISFPAVVGEPAAQVTYTVNNVYQQLELEYE